MGEKTNQRKIGFVMSYVSIFISSMIGIVFTPYMILELGKIEYGLYQVLHSTIGYIAVLDFGLGSTLTRYILKYKASGEQEKVDSVVAISVKIYCGIGLLAMLIVAGLSANLDVIFSETINEENLRYAQKIFVIMGVTTAISLVSHALSGIQTAYEKYAITKGVYIFKLVARVAVITVLLQLDMGAMAVVIADLIVVSMLLVFDIFYCKAALKFKLFRGKWDNGLAKSLLSFSAFAFLQILITETNTNLDRILLGKFSTLEVVALYGVVMQLNSIFVSLGNIVSGVTISRTTNIVFSNPERKALTDSCAQYSRFQALTSLPLIGGFILFGQMFSGLWVPDYDSKEVWICTMLIVIPYMLSALQGTIFNVMKAKNMQKMRSLILFGVMLLNIVLTIVLMQWNDIYGPAIATCLSYVLGNLILSNIYYHKRVGIDMFRYFRGLFKGILPAWIISIAIGIGIAFIPVGGWLGFILKGFLYVIAYGLLILAIGLNKNERQIVVKVRKKLFKR